MKTKGIDQPFSDTDLSTGRVTGYFAVFGNRDLDGDVITKGAFAKSIQERGPKGKQLIKHLLDHKHDHVVAKIEELEEDDYGLKFVSKIGTHNLGQDYLKMVESGLINQASIGFTPIKEQYDEKARANFIKEIKLFEGSSLQFLGANPEAGMHDLKSTQEYIDYLDRLEKFIKTSDATDETLSQLEEKYKSLLTLFEPTVVTHDEEEADEQLKQIIDQTFQKYYGS